MLGINVPLPGRVERVADGLAPALAALDEVRERRTLLLKRLGDPESPARAAGRARRALAGAGPVEVRVVGVDAFEEPATGRGPVWYLAVESPGLRELHRRLVDAFGAVEGMEGGAYVPHITLGRGGPPGAVDRSVEPVAWTARELWVVDARRGERVGRVSLGDG